MRPLTSKRNIFAFVQAGQGTRQLGVASRFLC